MFGLLKDLGKVAGSIVGAISGTIIGVSASIVAEALGITEAMVNEARSSGCETYEEIKDFFDIN
jgi:hypothetical protein